MAQLTIKDAAKKYDIIKSTLLWQVEQHPERFCAHREAVPYQPRPVWFIDDECPGFVSWLAQHRQEKQPKPATKKREYQNEYYMEHTKKKRKAIREREIHNLKKEIERLKRQAGEI